MKKKAVKKEKQERVEYFTDDMHKDIFLFQDQYKASKGGKPVVSSVSLSMRKK